MFLTVEIVTPEKIAWKGEVDSIVLPAANGEVGILPGHIPYFMELVPGDCIVTRGTEREHIAVDKGFAEVLGNKVTVITDAAINVRNIDIESVENARAAAEKALADAIKEGRDPAEIEKMETLVRFAIAQKLAAGRRH